MTYTNTPAGSASDLAANKRLAVSRLRLLTEGRNEELLRTTAPDWRMHGGPLKPPAGPDGIRAPCLITSVQSTRPGRSTT